MSPTTRQSNQRRLFRETLNATAILRVRDDEFICKTCDISENGLGLLIRDGAVEANEPVEANVLIGNVMKTFRGVVLYTQSLAHGPLRVGMRFANHCQTYDAVGTQSSEPARKSRQVEGASGGFDTEAVAETVRTNRRVKVQSQPRSDSESLEDISDRIGLDALLRLCIRKGLVSEREILSEVEAGRARKLTKIDARDAEH